MPAVRVLVSGRVQGVGFRAFVHRTSMALGVVGQVWNTRDGEVELIAQHASTSVLAELATRLRTGPGWVRDVSVQETTESADRTSFEVGPTR